MMPDLNPRALSLGVVAEQLCQYDVDHPDYAARKAAAEAYGEEPEPRNPKCACDNCFYGRDRLAREILRLNALVRQLQSQRP
jgi:hypothetical protein